VDEAKSAFHGFTVVQSCIDYKAGQRQHLADDLSGAAVVNANLVEAVTQSREVFAKLHQVQDVWTAISADMDVLHDMLEDASTEATMKKFRLRMENIDMMYRLFARSLESYSSVLDRRNAAQVDSPLTDFDSL